ncbi:MAG: insulinase family protein, partial [Coriobacteriaceae bacterium]|nr:insulinase family protein [Coriobacteriaceae bacterium]
MSEETRSFSEPRADLAVGSVHGEFEVVEVYQLPELSGCAYRMRHMPSGARMLWIACDDANRAFAIGFKTPPADDTGVFHILEHSVLCGSERFPVKEPFVTLLKTSMQTFLNAMTFPDKTLYPVASTNVTDLENLMDVYLDAVLHPAIYTRPRIFEQEGWHFELESPEAPLTYNGVVLNEMKGAMSDPDDVLFQAVGRELYPDTAYRFESGGAPRAIPTLTYEQFLDNHARHYNLANSYTILYGDLDIDRELAFIASRFATVEKRTDEAPNPLELQKPVSSPLRRIEMATAPENASVALAYVVGTSSQRERMTAADVLLDALCGSNEAPLKRRVLDAGLGEDLSVSLIDSLLQPMVLFVLKGAKEGAAEQFRELVETTCTEIAQEGVPTDKLSAALAQTEFNLREGDWGVSDGVAHAMTVLTSWLYDDDDPVSYLRYEQVLANLKAGLGNGYFEQLLRELIPENDHSALVELVPVEEGDSAEEAAELARIKAGMTADDIAHVIAEVAALRAEQEREDAPE